MDAETAISLTETCDDALKIYHIFSINGHLENEVAIDFTSPKWIHALQQAGNNTLLQADATFYVVPNQFFPIIGYFPTIPIIFFPAIHILMTKKTGSLYDLVLRKIKRLTILCD